MHYFSIKYNSQCFVTSFIYAANDQIYRRRLWSYLDKLKDVVNNFAWILLADFNVLASPTKCKKSISVINPSITTT